MGDLPLLHDRVVGCLPRYRGLSILLESWSFSMLRVVKLCTFVVESRTHKIGTMEKKKNPHYSHSNQQATLLSVLVT